MRLSIVIPVYKTEQYLRRCLDSLVYGPDVEVIVVNDGSSAECQEIVNEYVTKGLQLKYIAHAEKQRLITN